MYVGRVSDIGSISSRPSCATAVQVYHQYLSRLSPARRVDENSRNVERPHHLGGRRCDVRAVEGDRLSDDQVCFAVNLKKRLESSTQREPQPPKANKVHKVTIP